MAEITYTWVNGIGIPNLKYSDQPDEPLGRYGMMRLNYMRENCPVKFEIMAVEGTLYPSIAQREKEVKEQIKMTMEALQQQEKGPDRSADPVGWAQWMNGLKLQAEELAMPLLYSL